LAHDLFRKPVPTFLDRALSGLARRASLDKSGAMPTIVARLDCDEATARRLALALGESLDGESAVCAAVEEAGAWQLAIYFRDAPNRDAIRGLVALAGGDAAALGFETLPDADWVTLSLVGLAPVRVGRFFIHGAHDRARAPVNAVAIEIEAAQAFGTGHHGSTAGCLMALERIAKGCRARRVLDIGTGSGVLAIAAAKLFRRPVVASDIDPVAVAAARNNARLNRVAPLIVPLRAAGTRARAIARGAPYDLIVANILLGPILRLPRPLALLAAPRAHLHLSGLPPSQANGVLALYSAQGFALSRRILREGWVTLMLQKRNRPGWWRPGRSRR
jgi:ribosomal protein L11 methyltransferase